jgi:hypothetical protein
VDGQVVAQLAELSTPYRGKDPSAQEYELAMALVHVEESQIPDLGAKDYWLRVRNNLVKKIVEQRVAIEATSVVAADMVLKWAASSGLDYMVFQVPLAILTAMIIDSAISAIGKGDRHVKQSRKGSSKK